MARPVRVVKLRKLKSISQRASRPLLLNGRACQRLRSGSVEAGFSTIGSILKLKMCCSSALLCSSSLQDHWSFSSGVYFQVFQNSKVSVWSGACFYDPLPLTMFSSKLLLIKLTFSPEFPLWGWGWGSLCLMLGMILPL